ncbi:MAG: hypothetical protein EOM26_10730 [Alphaproteobacteria bacterium]|nr:hypothetical protein [Alphaproteobacteria bacterium]
MTSHLPYSISVIADYGPLSDMAFAEVTQSIYKEMGHLKLRLKEYSVPPFDTHATGFFLAETAINSHLGKRHFFYVNTAPRHDDENPKADSEGEKLVYVRLTNDVRIVAVNSGYSLSFIKPAIAEARVVEVENAGSQFRSRDFYPKVLGEIAHDNYDRLTNREPEIPDAPEDVVCITDGYGNLKTSIDPEKLADSVGKYLSVSVNGQKHFVKAGRSIFDVPDGHLCMAKGSSGWTLPDGTRRSFTEIVCRSGNAFLLFKKPKGGAAVKWAEG